MATVQAERGVPLSTLCPKFLHSNSTSHTSPFSAVAELIDNAYDPGVDAKEMSINNSKIRGQDCLIFMDDGKGLCYDAMHKMLSFGYSNKKAEPGKHPIGMYGNGFKSGSMRLGKDAIVLSKSEKDLCVGMLSQSYLEKTKVEHIAVPIISIKEPGTNTFHVLEQHGASLSDILRYSLFTSEEELLRRFEAIKSSTGTLIIIWNLRSTSEGSMELDFKTHPDDIRIPSDGLCSEDNESDESDSEESSGSSIAESAVSLSAYCSILYEKPSLQISIRGKRVEPLLISNSLGYIQKYCYNPQKYNETLHITFGTLMDNKEQYGIMMYHKNRLIKAYHPASTQKNVKSMERIIGVIECNHLKPTHNKQDFDNSDLYRNTITNLVTKFRKYRRELAYRRRYNIPRHYVPNETAGMQRQPSMPKSKRQKLNGDESASGSHMDLRSRNPPTSDPSEEKKNIVDLEMKLKESRDEVEQLNSKVKQLEEEKAKKIEELSKETEAFSEANSSLLRQIQEQANQIKDLHLKVKQLEEDKASISAEFEKKKLSHAKLKSKMAVLLDETG